MDRVSSAPPGSSGDLLSFLKALADGSRLKIIGLLARQPLAVEQLAEALGLSAATVSHHLSILATAGLVSAQAQGYYSVYSLNLEAVEAASRQLISRDALAAGVGDVDLSGYERKVVAGFSLPDGRLKTIPAQKKKLEIVLRHIVKVFEPDLRYSEAEVNEKLARYHRDTASLRRELIGFRLLDRSRRGDEYWRPQESSR